ncbi:MAG: restriction endonuclease subunit S [Sulfuricella denitrificans]|nr:restriction endonuclease subunit S [Sulfuricella denitrificans]
MKKGWQSKPFENCIEKVTYTTKIQRKDFLDAGAFPVVSQEDAFINGYWDGADDVFRVETPLVVFGDHTKVLKYVDFDFVLGADGVKLLPPKEFLVPKFFYYQLQTAQLDSLGYARHYKLLKELEIKYPDRAEQHRIVGILDAAFDGIATAKANAEKNLQNARALFESHLQSVFTERGEGWVETAIGDCIRFIDYRGKTPVKTESGIRLITAKNVKMGYLQDKPMEFIASAGYKGWMTRGIPQKGDVLFTTEAPLANVAQLDTDEKVAFAQRIIIMQPDMAKLDSTFLKYLLLSQPVQQRIRTKGTGATVQGIKASLLKAIEISFPKTLGEQEQIVSKLDALATETQRLESIYQQKLTALDDLKKSLLHQAFSGQL